MDTSKDIMEKNTRFGFWTLTLIEVFIGSVLVGLLFLFIDIRKNPIFFVIIVPIILGYIVGSAWYRGKLFLDIFGHYPWEKKLLSDEDIED